MNYTRITGSKNGVQASVLFFVPLKTWAEVQKLTLTNASNEVKHLKLFSFAEWCLWNAATDMENFQRNFSTGEVEIDGSVIYHKTEYKERRNHYAYYSVNVPIQGFDTDRESFIGLYNEFGNPDCVMAGSPKNSVAHGWSPIASHYIEVELQPGESKDYIFVLGYVENEQEEKYDASADNNQKVISSLGALDHTFVNKEKARTTISQFDTTEKVSVLLILHRHNSPTEAAITSISRLPSEATTTLVAVSMMTRAGLFSERLPISRRRATSLSSTRWFHLTISQVQKSLSLSISAYHSIMWLRISVLTSCH